ncbi:MAG: tail fiber domain-containing protein [Gemmatimonadales bacterium]
MHLTPRFVVAALLGSAFATVRVAAPAAAQAPLLEVEKSDATKLLQVNDDAGFVVKGTLNTGRIPAVGPGVRLMWYPGKAAFRVGVGGPEWEDSNIGVGSVALGEKTVASGASSLAMGFDAAATSPHSTAIGYETRSSGTASTALGERTSASGASSTAMGARTTASGPASTAMGSQTKAVGVASTAMGRFTTALGDQSTAMGSNAAAATGGFAYGDGSTNAVITALPDQFAARASGGFRFRTSANLSTGCDLPAGSGTFACTSSRLAKEGFEDVDAEAALEKLADIPIQRWRYVDTRAEHIGPTSEDFHAAFGLGEGSRTIATVDADGIALLGVQALERRTATLRDENAALRAEVAALRAQVEKVARGPAGGAE